jgi:phosphatidyl-myo-inositol alpha-mannosyltransferase
VLRFHHGANVATFHTNARRNLGYYYGRPFLDRYFKRLHACIAVSVPARDFISRYFPGDYRIVPNGIDTSRFHPDHPGVADLRTSGMKTLLFVGRMEQRKGFGILLEAYAQLRRRRSDLRLVAVGDGPQRERYERQVDSFGIPDVLFSGRISNEMLPRYYTSADVFCSPATGGESFGIVLLEAMASGVPVLASAIPGFTAVIDGGKDGLLVPPNQPRVLAQAIDTLLQDEALCRAMSANGLRTAQQYDWHRVADSILDVYDEARGRSRVHMVAAGVHRQVSGMG